MRVSAKRPTGLLTFAAGDYTGASRMGTAVATALLSAGHRVVAACGPAPQDQPAVKDVLAKLAVPVYEVGRFDLTLDWGLVLRLRKILREENIDYIVTFFVTTDTRHAGIASIGLKIPVLASVQISVRFQGARFVQYLKKLGFGLVYRNCVDRALCTSEMIRDDLISRYRVPASRIEVLPNGVDTSLALTPGSDSRKTLRAKWGVQPNETLLINVGRIDEQKGQLILVEALRKLDQRLAWKLLLVGDVTAYHKPSELYRDRLRKAIEEAGFADRIHMLGWRDDVPQLLKAADVYVHSALWEGPPLPLSALEAMAHECPVVLTDCSGRPAGFVDGQHGYVTKTGVANSLADALHRILSLEADDKNRMGRAAQTLCRERYDIRRIAERYVELCNEVVTHRHPPSPALALGKATRH